MNAGDRVRICAGRAKGHQGVIKRLNGDSADVEVSMPKSLADGNLITVRRANLVVLRLEVPLRRREFTPYTPPPFRVPRSGSDVASRLPSVAGQELIYPEGLRP